MAKILTIGDPHLKISSIPAARQFVSWLHDVVVSVKPDFAVNLGDTFHTHNVIRSEVLALVADHVRWMNRHVEYFVLVGNHDMAHHKTPHIHAWLPFKDMLSSVHVVDEPFFASDVSFFPYIDDPEVFLQNFGRASEKPLLFCHQAFIGADYGFVTSKDGVPLPSWWDGQIISGHVHKAQKLGCVWYPGTPYAQEASDSNATKGIYLYDTESRSAELIESPLPRWVTVKVSPDDFFKVVKGMNPTDKNHVVIEGPAAELNALLASRQLQELKRDVGFSVKKQPTDGAFNSKALKKTSTLQDAVVEYIDRIYEGKVDKNTLKGKVLSALQ